MKHKTIIIGAGPIGLYLASKCEDCLILEATNEVGGQLTSKYPEKEIVDIPGITSIKAKDYIKLLSSKVDTNRILLNEKVIDIIPGNPNKLITFKNEYDADYVVIATGLGFSLPRALGVEGEKNCSNILYSLKDFEFLRNKKVAIFGGGDSALDWAKALSKISNDVSLIHRRTEFRGNPETIKDCNNLKLFLPYIPYSMNIDNKKATSITVKKVSESEEKFENISVDYILVNYGSIPEIPNFNFEKKGSFLLVNKNMEVAPNIFAIGDVSEYENKTRRIAPGLCEANKILEFIS